MFKCKNCDAIVPTWVIHKCVAAGVADNGVNEMQAVKMETRWFVECPECDAEHDVETYESGEIECVCETKFEYDNGNPEKAEAV